MPEPEDDEQQEGGSGRPFWSGTLTFGLVSVPVSLYAANRSARVRMRSIGPNGAPLKRRYYSQSGKPLENEDIVRGYQLEDGRYVVVTDDELERLAPEKSRDIDLRRFVEDKAIPRLHFERGYFLVPAGGSTKAYRLLAETMQRTGRAGIATFVMRGKEYLVAILAENGLLRAETLRFHDEIRTPESIGLPERGKPQSDMVKQFVKLIGQMEGDELPVVQMKDEASAKILEIAQSKLKSHQDVITTPENEADEEEGVTDLLAALQKTLAGVTRKAPARSEKAASPDQERMSKQELYQRAKELNIPGRSSMSREQLESAVRKAS